MATEGLGCGDLPIVSTVCRGATGLVTDPVGTVTSVGGAAVGAATEKVGQWLVAGVNDAGTSLVEGLDHQLQTATTPNLGAGWFLGNYNSVLGVALVVAIITFLIQIISSLIRREPGMLSRALTGSAVAVIGGFAILAFCQVAIAATDELCSGLLGAAGAGSLGNSLRSLWLDAITTLGPGAWLLAIFLGFLFIIGSIMLWVAMFLREISIYVLAVFAPIAFAGYGWDRTRSWLRRWGEIVAALVFSKLVIYVIFILGMAMVSSAGSAGGLTAAITQLLGGACLVFMAAISPWATHRFISFAGNAAGDAHEHGSPRSAVGAAAITGVTTSMVVGRKIANTVGGGVMGGPAGAAAGATQPAGGDQVAQQVTDAGAPSAPPDNSGGGDGGGAAPQSTPGPGASSGGGGSNGGDSSGSGSSPTGGGGDNSDSGPVPVGAPATGGSGTAPSTAGSSAETGAGAGGAPSASGGSGAGAAAAV